MPTVSVLIPAWNALRFIDETIESVLAQTFTDFEIVAVDDASGDTTYARLQEWAARDARIRPFRNERNLGMTGNWNRALGHATGELVIKLDSDDLFRPKTLEVLVAAMREADVVGAGVRTLMCDEEMQPFDGLPADDAMMRAGIDPYADATLECSRWYAAAAHGQQLWHSCAILLRREWMLRGGGFDERFGCASDTEIVWRALEEDGRFAHRAYVGLLYRIRPDSVSAVFRQNDWLTWEAVAGNLLTLHRYRTRHGLPRALRLRYASLWERWQSARGLPDAIRDKLGRVVAETKPPAAIDRLQLRARNAMASLAGR